MLGCSDLQIWGLLQCLLHSYSLPNKLKKTFVRRKLELGLETTSKKCSILITKHPQQADKVKADIIVKLRLI